VLASTLRQDEPAPTPNSVKLADAKPFLPATLSPVERGPRLASVSANDAGVEGLPVRRASFVAPLRPTGGAEQILNGRGLY
jgi:hypothetical protein